MNFNRLLTRSVTEDVRTQPPFSVPERHAVLGTPLQPPFPEGLQTAVFALGCFWGAERLFWRLDGVYSTAAGYAGGTTAHPTYRESAAAGPDTRRRSSSSWTPPASPSAGC